MTSYKSQEGEYEEPRFLSEGSKNILRCMMQVNPKHRLSVQDLLRHTWFLDGRGEPVPVIYDITMVCSMHTSKPFFF